MKIFTNHRYALITGIVLARGAVRRPDALAAAGRIRHSTTLSLARWVHIVSGVFWIGLLYYFNAVQTPALADAAADKGGPGGAGVNKYVAPRALFWFRWSALATWLAGAWLLVASASCPPSRSATRTARTTTRPSSSASAPGSAPSCC